jgi:hypothetical protein
MLDEMTGEWFHTLKYLGKIKMMVLNIIKGLSISISRGTLSIGNYIGSLFSESYDICQSDSWKQVVSQQRPF